MEWERAEWQTDPAAAYAEARRRIAHAASAEDPEEREEIYFSDLTALEEIPPEIAEAPLKRLWFLRTPEGHDKTFFGGLRKITDISALAGLSGLETLDLSGTSARDLSPLAGLSALTKLELIGSSASDLSPLAGLSALTTLNLNDTSASDLSPLAGLTALTVLDLRSTSVADLSPLLDIPRFAAEEAEYLDFSHTPAADPANDRRLDFLSRLPEDRCAIETIQYLKGTHPDFRDPPARSGPSALAAAAPVDLTLKDGKPAAANPGPPARLNPEELAQRIAGQKQMVAALQAEAAHAQIPPALLRRLALYADALEPDPPIFFVLDAPMSMIRGSIADSYLTEGLDDGLKAGFESLIASHGALDELLTPPSDAEEAALDALPEPAEEATPAAVEGLIDEAIDATEGQVDDSVDSVFGAMKEIAKSQKENTESQRELAASVRNIEAAVTKKHSITKRILGSLGGLLTALGSAAGIASWAATPHGAALIARLQPILERIMQFFGFA